MEQFSLSEPEPCPLCDIPAQLNGQRKRFARMLASWFNIVASRKAKGGPLATDRPKLFRDC